MKVIQILPVFVSLVCLTFIVGCGDTENPSNAVDPIVSTQALPADDDIQGLYNLGVPHNWNQTEDPVLYAKYFRARLLRTFGNKPEIHTVADMALKERQHVSPTPDEYIAYLKAHYRLFKNPETLEKLTAYQEGTRVAGGPGYSNQLEVNCCSAHRMGCTCPEPKPCAVKCDP